MTDKRFKTVVLRALKLLLMHRHTATMSQLNDLSREIDRQLAELGWS